MAILNFANTYEEVAGKLQLPESDSGEYVQLVFTKDGHIITHGVDYTPIFSPGKKGLVPGSNGKQTEFIRGNGQWLEITTADLPIATSVADAISQNKTNTTILNTQQIIEYVGNSFAANDAMRYKGTITYEDDKYYTHTTEGVKNEGFPSKCQVGDTYRIATAATYAGQKCEVGDLITCIKDGEGGSLNNSEYWTVLQTNINGQVKHTVNGTSIYTYSNSQNTFNIYAPTTGGTQNQILISNGSSAPTWINQSNIVAGQANRVANALSVGTGLYMGGSENTYDGSVARTISLLKASNAQLGGVIIDKDSENKTISVDSSTGNIYLTAQNIINALGYTPGSSETLIYQQVLANTSQSTSQTEELIVNPYINMVQISGQKKSVTSSYQLIGVGGIRVDAQDSVTIRLNQATSSELGGIKIGYTSADKNYAVQLSSTGQAYVNVPWVGTTYGLATATEDGLVPKFDALGTGSLAPGSWVLSKLANGTYDWFALPSQAFSDSWRPITIGGASIGNKTLNFIPTGDIYIKADSNGDDIQDISFGLSWYNISTEKYETA